ncbi:hypothetical protein ACFE04_028797 [Oxalis oulophora]
MVFPNLLRACHSIARTDQQADTGAYPKTDGSPLIMCFLDKSKGYFRRGATYLAMTMFEKALKDFQQNDKGLFYISCTLRKGKLLSSPLRSDFVHLDMDEGHGVEMLENDDDAELRDIEHGEESQADRDNENSQQQQEKEEVALRLMISSLIITSSSNI